MIEEREILEARNASCVDVCACVHVQDHTYDFTLMAVKLCGVNIMRFTSEPDLSSLSLPRNTHHPPHSHVARTCTHTYLGTTHTHTRTCTHAHTHTHTRRPSRSIFPRSLRQQSTKPITATRQRCHTQPLTKCHREMLCQETSGLWSACVCARVRARKRSRGFFCCRRSEMQRVGAGGNSLTS